MQGRITEEHLPAAEKSFPGICQVYADLADKPVTFLQLVWIYEDLCERLAAGSDTDLLADTQLVARCA